MLAIFLLLQLVLNSIATPVKQPHIVLIIADDVGWNDFGFHGSNQIPTPNIDALAYNGMILNRFYTLPSCTPSRSALLTGYYPIRLGTQGLPITAGQSLHLPLDIPTLPEKLQKLGYKTNLIGKWHLGADYRNATPTRRGFDAHFGYWNGYIGYFNHYAENMEFDGLDLYDNLKPDWTKQGQYATDLFTEKAEEVIRQHNISKPLFLMVAHLAGHTGRLSKLEVPNIEKANQDFYYIADSNRRLYADVVRSLDNSVGKIVSYIKQKGILDDTIIVFISDNGAQTFGLHENFGSNWPLRGLKFSLHEGGVRNAAIIYSSKLRRKGVINNELFHISDLMPTLYAAAGGNPTTLEKIDGVNQWNTIIHEKPTVRSEILLNIDDVYQSSGFISNSGRYKLINGSTVWNESYGYHYGDSGRDINHTVEYNIQAIIESDVNRAIGARNTLPKINLIRQQIDLAKICKNKSPIVTPCKSNELCLFDLYIDPCETKNIASYYPNLVKKLTQRIAYYTKQSVKPKDLFIDPKSNPIYYNNTWTTWLDNEWSI